MPVEFSNVQVRVYCTYFDSGYLARGLSLIQSLRDQGDFSRVLVLALDQRVIDFFAAQPISNVVVISVEALEEYEPSLLREKNTRSRMEYYFTCTPILIEYALVKYSAPDSAVVYLDADLFFFNDPNLIFEEFRSGSIGIIEHKYSPALSKKLTKYGKYNVGLVAFRNDENGTNLLTWYKESCLGWCSDKPTNGLYADQGYLNSFPDWPGCVVLKSPGFNLAPWNDSNFTLEANPEGAVKVGSDPLVFFHFHGIKKYSQRYITSEFLYQSKITTVLRNNIYIPYLATLEHNQNRINSIFTIHPKNQVRGSGIKGLVFRVYKNMYSMMIVLTGNSIKLSKHHH